MDELESRLRQIPLKPPVHLDRRMEALFSKPPVVRENRSRSVAMGWAVAASLAMGVIGFAAGVTWRGYDLERQAIGTKELQIIIKNSDVQPFDFTVNKEKQIPKQTKIDVVQKEEI